MKAIGKREEKILKNIVDAVNNMSDFEKGYLLGIIESRVSDKQKMNMDINIKDNSSATLVDA